MSEILSLPILMEAQTFALGVAASGVAVGALLLLAAWLLRRRSENMRYGILLGGTLVLLAVPALVGIGRQLPPEIFGATAADEVVRLPAERLPELLAGPGGMEAAQEGVEQQRADIPWGLILGFALLGIWVLGIAIGLARLVCALWKQSRILIGQPWRADYWTDALRSRFASQLGLAKFPTVYRSPVAPMPMVIGTWRPVIVLPEQAPDSWGQPQWEAILLHEAAHIARRDPWAMLAQRLAVILFWWCPLVHGLARQLNALREDICDDYALAGSCDPVAYAEILVESAERFLSLKAVPVSLALLDSAQRGLEVRVTRLLAKEKRPMTKLSILGKLLGAGVLGAACLATTAATALSQSQPEKKVQIKIIVDGKEIDLGDPRLWDEIQAAQKKKANPTVNFVLSKDNKETPTLNYRYVVETEFAKKAGDPRVEELVKQAEAIKPGSGAAIRKALQGTASSGEAAKTGYVRSYTPDGKQLATVGDDKTIRLWDATTGKEVAAHIRADGKKLIILSIDGDKVTQLKDSDVKKYIDGGIQWAPETRRLPVVPPTPATKKASEPARVEVNLEKVRKTETKAVTANPVADVEALRQQLERLATQLQALERRLEMKAK